MKFLMWLCAVLASLVIAAIPETVMYFIYGFIAPDSAITKIILFAVFWYGGFSMCILFLFLAAGVLAAATKALL